MNALVTKGEATVSTGDGLEVNARHSSEFDLCRDELIGLDVFFSEIHYYRPKNAL